jgi:hypothetical protein
VRRGSEFRSAGESFLESETLQSELLAHALGAEVRVLDFIARLAECWDGAPPEGLSCPERRALCELSQLPFPGELARWSDLPSRARQLLLIGARRAVRLGRTCTWVYEPR